MDDDQSQTVDQKLDSKDQTPTLGIEAFGEFFLRAWRSVGAKRSEDRIIKNTKTTSQPSFSKPKPKTKTRKKKARFVCVLQISCSFSFVLGLRLGLEQAGNPFCLLINSSWLLVFISLFYLLLMAMAWA